ncbi:MAG: hypothetical protein IJS99_09415 [Synergistaceae bacterium]|nr:hypothetical protein [Synergistaceae bacterium]
MQKKFLFIFILTAFIFAGSDSLFARTTPSKSKKFSDSVLTNCSIYQLGTDEFVLRLNGDKLSEPLIQFNNNVCYITLYNTLVNKPEKLNAEIQAYTETIPIITDFKIENLSDDLINKAAITITTANPLKLHTLSQIREGFSLRLIAKNNNVEFRTNASPVKVVTKPKSLLPFNADEKITIELREISLMDVIRMFMTQLGRNVIIDNSFPKSVNITLSLVDVRIDEVLNYLMRTYNIACYSAGANTTVFGTREGLYKLSGEDETRTFDISYAKPDAVKTMIVSLSGIRDSDVVVDERLHSLHVRTNPAKMQEVTEIINKIDMPGKQIMIRASILEFSDTATREVANALDIIYNEYAIQWAAGAGTITYDNTVTDMQKIITNSFSNLERRGVGKVLANPSVIAIDGQQAEISLTEDYPYISARDQAGNVTWSTENVGPKLTFTPRVGRDGFVNLKIDIQTGDVLDTMTSSTGEQMPRTSSRSVKTEIRVREGMPFVVGGLFRENTVRQVLKIPVLGDIPLIGDLFRTRSREKNKTQVVMVVTPYILDSK